MITILLVFFVNIAVICRHFGQKFQFSRLVLIALAHMKNWLFDLNIFVFYIVTIKHIKH